MYNNQLDYTPMPGETLKGDTGETGEIENPYYDSGFEDLANENNEQGFNELNSEQEKQIPTESGNALEDTLNRQWSEGRVDIEAAEQNINSNYIEGAAIQSTTSANAEADIAEAERDSIDTPGSEQPKNINQPREISNAAAMEAIAADVISDDLVDKIKAGDDEAIANIEEVEQHAARAESLADKIANTANNNATSEQELNMARSAAEQVREMATEAADKVFEAKAEYDALSEDEKEITKEAAEAAAANGTDIELEKQKLEEDKEAEDEKEEEKDKFTPDMSRGIFD